MKWPRVGGTSLTRVEQLLVFSAQPICMGSPHSAHGWWFQVMSTPALLRPAVSVLALSAEPELLTIVTCCTNSPSLPWSVLSVPALGTGTILGLCKQELSFAHSEHSGFALLSVLQSTLSPHPSPRLFSPNDTHTRCLVRSVLFLSVPLLSACLDRTFVSRAGGTGILRDGFLGMVGLWDAGHVAGDEAGSVSSKA